MLKANAILKEMSGIDIAALTWDTIERKHPAYARNSIAQQAKALASAAKPTLLLPAKSETIRETRMIQQWSKAGAAPNFRVENPELYIQNFNC